MRAGWPWNRNWGILQRFAMKKKSRILTEMHESAAALYRSGSIDKQTMREFDALLFPQVRDLTPKQIRLLRAKTRMSQAVFAVFLNTSVSTVQKWEIGEKKPSGPSLKLLNLIDRKGVEALI
jgi:putative transcriptional regulator